jgi:hypothetical protein
MSNLELIQAKLPGFYRKYELKDNSEKSVMHAMIDAIAKNIDDSNAVIDRLDDSIGIDTTHNEDLEHRWGSLLGINKKATESYDLYRSELKMAIPSLIGGTKNAIIYAIAIVVGIEKDNALQADFIDVVDGWEYDGDADIPDEYRQYGCFVCTIDMSIGQGAVDAERQIIDSINKVKASGTSCYIVYKAFKISRYYQLDPFNYDTLDNTTYDNLGLE